MSNRISPLWLGIGISATLLVVLFVAETVFGRWDALAAQGATNALARVSEGPLRDIRIAIVFCLVMGYAPAAFVHVLRRGRQTIMSLQATLDCTREECERLAASIRLPVRGLVLVGIAGLVFGFVSPYMVRPLPEQLWNPAGWSAEIVWHRILGPLVSIAQAWLTYAVIVVSLRISSVAERLTRIDLLELSVLAPFTRLGLTNALMIIGLVSIWSLMMIETGFAQLMTFVFVVTVAVTILALVAPVRGVHRQIKRSKAGELSWVNAQIREQRNTLQQGGRTDGNRMADLVAYRALVEDVPEWPFTTSTYTRVVLYAIIPVLSWGLGVVAEEFVGRMLF